MARKHEVSIAWQTFAGLKQRNEHDVEYWRGPRTSTLAGLQPVAAFRAGDRTSHDLL